MASFKPQKHKLEMWENTTHKESMQFLDKNDQLIDITGYTAKMTIKDEIDGDEILTLDTETLTGSRLIIDEDISKFTIYIETVLEDYVGVYDVFFWDALGQKHKPIDVSPVKIFPAVTDLEA